VRIVHVVTAFPRAEEDVITPWMVEMIARLRDRGHEAEVLAPAYRGSPSHAVRGIPVRRFRYAPAACETLTHAETAPDRVRRSPAHAALVPLYAVAGVAAGWRTGRRREPAVVHAHWPVPHALFGAAARAGSGGRAALVCSFYAVEVNWVRRRLRWLRPLLRWSARTADAVTAISSSTARSVEEASGREPRVVPFAAAVDEEVPAASLREPLSGDGPLRILFVGRLVERKGVEVLVRALPRILEHRDAELTVVGEGPRAESIRRTARRAGVADRVSLTGFLSREELSRRYAGCDIFVLPAVVDRKGDTEGLGVVLLEALRRARPVVASEVGGIPDIVRDGRTGWLVPAGDEEALARRVLELCRQPERARRVAREGRAFAEERFGWDRVLDDLETVYEEARRRRRAAGAGAGEGAA